jgi:DHA2 family multidrug resistance protein
MGAIAQAGAGAGDKPAAATPTENLGGPLTGWRLMIAAIAVGFGNFLVILDTTIANVSIPTIAGSLGVSPSQGTWVITSYAVAEAITVPLTGWLVRRFGARRTFISCYAAFGLLSLMCGLSYSLGMLVTSRVLLGLCGGPLIPLSQILLLRIFPPEKAVVATVIWALTTLLAPVAGPILGGIISDSIGWPWIFFINVPVAALFGSIAWILLRGQPDPKEKASVDMIGLGLMVLWVGSLQIMIDEGRNLDWFNSGQIQILAAVSLIGFLAFLIWELTEKDPIINLRIFRHRGFTVTALTMCFAFGAFFASLIIFPLWLQQNMGYTATWAGFATAFMGLTSFLFGPPIGKAAEKMDPRLLISIGLALMGLAHGWRTFLTPDMTFLQIALPTMLAGVGMVMLMIPASGMALASVPPREAGDAAGLSNFMRVVAGAFGAALAQTGWSNAMRESNTEMVSGMTHGSAVVDDMVQSGMTQDQAITSLAQIVDAQSMVQGTIDMFGIITLVFFATSALIWLAPRPSGPINAAAGH